MKKFTIVLMSAVIALSLTGCSNKPSEKKIKTALDEGTITIEDAKAKGWIDEAWIKANFKVVEGGSKIHLFESFETTYLDGTAASSDIIAGTMNLVFFNTEKDGTQKKLKILNDIYGEMKEIGVPTIGIIIDKDIEAAKEKLADIKFPIIVYNEEMATSLKDYSGILDGDVVSVFTKEGGFYSAWNSDFDKEELLSSAKAIANEK